MKLLWVENHATFARLAVAQFLGDHAVTVVPSLAEARSALSAGAFDVVLIDFDLDDGKGDELVRELRPTRGRPWLVATSSHEAGNDALVRAGVDAVCSKLEIARIGERLAYVSGQVRFGMGVSASLGSHEPRAGAFPVRLHGGPWDGKDVWVDQPDAPFVRVHGPRHGDHRVWITHLYQFRGDRYEFVGTETDSIAARC